MGVKTCSFSLSPDGYICQWLTAGLFADLVVPDALPAEGEDTAGERWTLRFTPYRRIEVPGYRNRPGTWWLAVCGLRSDEAVEGRLVVEGPEGSRVGTEDAGLVEVPPEGYVVGLSPSLTVLVVAIPAKGSAQAFSARLEGAGLEGIEVVHHLDTSVPVRINRVAARDVWIDHEGEPAPTIWMEVLNITDQPAKLRAELVTDGGKYSLPMNQPVPASAARLLEIPYPREVARGRARLVLTARRARVEREVVIGHTDHDWQVHIVPHFHYDPVWWNTQANYVERDERSAFRLIEEYLEAASDPDFAFVIEQVPYTKPYWDSFPLRRNALGGLLSRGRLEVAGALYNEPQSTLVSAEALIRNICYGTTYHRRQYGAERMTAWMLDVFGHDPNFPQLLARAGHHSVAYARGPYKRCWGIPADRLNFPVEYWWVAPDGSRVLARLLEPGSYGFGYGLRECAGPEEAWWEVGELFEAAAAYTAAHVQIWPAGGDFARAIAWLGELVRQWNESHLSPILRVSTPSEFFAALRARVGDGRAAIPAMTRDLNPVNNGCGVSYVDTKLANRLCERLVATAEALCVAAGLHCGAPFPHAALDLAWRQLLFNAHHDALTGTESDQVYLDLLGGWREAYEAARDAVWSAVEAMTDAGDSVVSVFNPLPWRRDGVVEIELAEDWSGDAQVMDGERAVPSEVVEAGGRRVLRFVARDVPALGVRTYAVRQGPAAVGEDLAAEPMAIENEFFRVEVDPLKGGGIVSLVDKRTGRELVQEGRVANDLVAHKEYPELPGYGEGPWHTCTTGEKHHASEEFPARVSVEHSGARVSLVVDSEHVECRRRMRITLWTRTPRVDFQTDLFDYTGADWLFKAHFPLGVRGGRPLYEVAGAVVSRTYCPGDQDTSELPWTQDNYANHWVDLTVPLIIKGTVGIGGEVLCRKSAGMAEIVCPPDWAMEEGSPISQLLLALSSAGVSATVAWPEWRRFGDLAWDSNVPDFRLVIGGPEENSFTRHILSQAGGGVEEELREWIGRHNWAVVLLPELELGLPAQVPILLVWAADAEAEAEALEHIAAQIRELREVVGLIPAAVRESARDESPDDGGVAILNRGNVTYCCYADGTLTLSLMRSCTGWPSGTWIDGPRRTCPDGSGFQLEHWGHRFEYALVSHEGPWSDGELGRAGYEFNTALVAAWGTPKGIEAGRDYVAVGPETVVATAIKPAGASIGNPIDEPLAGNRVVLRLQECAGQAVEATVKLGWPVAGAWKCDLLENPSIELAEQDGTVRVALGQFETATVLIELDRPGPALATAAASAEPAQYARWWRYNRGAAPTGFVPAVALFDVDRPLQMRPGEQVEVALFVSAGYTAEQVRMRVTMEAPDGWVEAEPYEAVLPAGDYEVRNVRISVPAEAKPGQYCVVAVADAGLGPVMYDVVHVCIGQEPGALFDARIEPEAVRLADGDATVRVMVRNTSQSRLWGEVTLVGPIEAWPLYDTATKALYLEPGGEKVIEYQLCRRGRELSGWVWVLAKVAANGQLMYTPAVRVE